VTDIVVYGKGSACFGDHEFPCALGSAGIVDRKVEGDGGTPAGVWPLRRVLFRPDREVWPECSLPVSAIAPADGWCDDPRHDDYNRPVSLPFAAGYEIMWRSDHLYDLVIIVGFNDDPPIPGAGSAIFVHLASADFAPTAGCVALAREDLLAILPGLDQTSSLDVRHS